MTARPTKLRDGSWGARVPGKPDAGDIVTISTRSGKKWDAEIDSVLWTGKSKYGKGTESLCSLVGNGGGSSRSSGYSRRRRFEDDEGSSFPCHVCGQFCFSGDTGHCPQERR